MIKNFDINCCCCSACISVCPTDSIFLATHNNGYNYPVINNQTCIKCNKCSTVCPLFINEEHDEKKTFVGITYSENRSEHSYSSSGGFCYNFAKLFLNNGGVVYSSNFDRDLQRVSMRRFDTNQIDDLETIRGSKYAKTHLGSIFRQIKQDLISSRNVCVIAMPCETKGLDLYLGKKYDNLTSISLLCGGSISTNYFTHYINELTSKFKQPIENINFRDKKYGPIGYLTSVDLTSKRVYLSARNDAYIKMLSSEFVRPSCKNCTFGPMSFSSSMLVCDYHHNNKVGYKTLILEGEMSAFANEILSLMEANIVKIDQNDLNRHIAYRGKEKQTHINEELYCDFYNSLLKKGTYITVKNFIFKKMTFKQKFRVYMPNFLKGIIYGNKK